MGLRSILSSAVSPSSRGAASGLKALSDGSLLGSRGALGLRKFLWPHRVSLGFGMLGLLLGAAMNLYLPQLLRRFIDTLANADTPASAAGGETLGLSWLVTLTLIVFAVQGLAFFVRSQRFGVVSHQIAAEIRAAIYHGVLQRPPTFFDAHRSGDLAARLSSEVQLVQDALGVRFIVLVRYGLQVVVGTVLMSMVSAKLTIALVVSLLVLVGIGFFFARALRSASKALSTEVGALTGLFTETLGGVKFLQAHSSVGGMTAKLDVLNQAAMTRGQDRVGVSATFQSVVTFLLNASLVLLGVYGLTLVSADELSPGGLGAFVSYAAIVAVSFSFLIASVSEVSQALGAWERLSELLSDVPLQAAILSSEERAEIPKIVFDNVSFAYTAKSAVALSGLSFTVLPGQHVALVGKSGAGKSTVLSLMLGFYEPTTGSIAVSIETNNGTVTRRTVRDNVVYVPQDPQLFGLSIRDNLRITAPAATDTELMFAMRRARLGDLLGGSMGITLDTQIGERGLTLSAGQRQRLGLARAFLSDAKVILLDEPTANLDSENEQAIQEALKELFAGRTTITIAHRFSTIMQSDLVLVLDAGKLVEHGRPTELIKGSGVFHHLASLQRQLHDASGIAREPESGVES